MHHPKHSLAVMGRNNTDNRKVDMEYMDMNKDKERYLDSNKEGILNKITKYIRRISIIRHQDRQTSSTHQ